MVEKYEDEDVVEGDSSGSGSEKGGKDLMDFVDQFRRRPTSPGSEITSEGEVDAEKGGPTTRICFDVTFDDYASAILQTQESRNETLRSHTFDVDGVPLVPSAWFQWRDRGFRLPHNAFFQTIHTAEPKSNLNSSLSFPEISKDRMQPSGLSKPGSHEFSAAQLLDKAGNKPGSTQSKRAILVGREPQLKGEDAHHYILNLEKDSVKVAKEAINISVDLDSLIWVTTPSGFKATGFNMYLSPSMYNRAAISNNNFIHVTLMDALQDEEELRNPRLRGSKNIPLSRIPHIEIGFCGSAERRINFIIFFPRMVHKPHKSRRFATLLPLCVQDLWYDRVVIPSCKEALKGYPGLSEYLPPSLQDLRNRLQYKQKSVIILDPSDVMKEVKRTIEAGGELLSCFGSFFVVADGRGMKVATKQCIPRSPAADEAHPNFEQIKQSLPDLDWDRMLDRKYGELYLDIGLSYHCNSQEPLTGLWRIPCLERSFSTMGSRSPTVHPLGTLAFYGGLKAEMLAKSKQDRHIISRISYCLAFETIRSPGTVEYLCSNKDVIERTPKFLESVRNWSELFLSAQSRSFGVRDEIRGLAPAVISFIPLSIEKVIFDSSKTPICK
jgi:hypothetical protein